MAETFARIRFTEGGFNTSQPLTVATGVDKTLSTDYFPCKEWSIADDILNMSDTAAVTIPNVDGENSGQFFPGQRVEIELSSADVRNGTWIKQFTGVVTEVQHGSDMSGGTVISLTMMDVGWYLTSCAARPLVNIKNKTFKQLLELLIDPSWGIGEIRASNDLNRRLRHGRQVIVQNFKITLGAILPFIQVEPGQKPFDIIQTYAQREGVLVNAAVDGALVFFRPDYEQQALYRVEYYGSDDSSRERNTVSGKPSFRQTIDGLYSTVECWSTVVLDLAATGANDAENPNAAFRHTTYTPSTSPIGFTRREVLSDPEAINDKLRRNRAIWKWQMGLFQSWQYDVDFDRHTQDGAFFVSDTMVTCADFVNKVQGVNYVQSVRKSQTLREGSKTTMVIRRPGLLNPELQELKIGGGAKGAAKVKGRKRGPSVDAIFAAADAKKRGG